MKVCARRRRSERQRQAVAAIAEGLLEYETLSGQEIKDLLAGKQPVRDTGDDAPSEGGGSAVPVTGKTMAKEPRPKKGGAGDMEPQPS